MTPTTVTPTTVADESPVVADEAPVLPAHPPPLRGEVAALAEVQRRLGHPTVVSAARGLSLFGEHAAGWLAAGAMGALTDQPRRREWLVCAAAVATAHALSIAVKRVVRRARPEHETLRVLVGTPSRLSFPSSHAASTTAATVLYGGMLCRPLTPVLVPAMLASRLVLGVHYPTDVVAGSALGAFIGVAVRRRLGRKNSRRRGWR